MFTKLFSEICLLNFSLKNRGSMSGWFNGYAPVSRFVLKQALTENSVLNFTYEIENYKKIYFLNTLITRTSHNVSITVHCKTTNRGECLNYSSICPQIYKIAVI